MSPAEREAAGAPGGRATLRALVRRLARVVRPVSARAASLGVGQAGLWLFPKRLFQLPPDTSPNPDGRNLAYLERAAAFWQATWREGADAASLETAAVDELHRMVVEAHVLERRLLAALEEDA